jgi:nicotinamidase-related amidase
MKTSSTPPALHEGVALILLGFQNDLFAHVGRVRDLMSDDASVAETIKNSVRLIDAFLDAGHLVVSAPLALEGGDEVATASIGMMGLFQERGAFRAGSAGAGAINEHRAYGDRIQRLPGRQSFNAFADTGLNTILAYGDVHEVVIAGALTSLCVDSTARSAHERGYRVSVVADATCARSRAEQENHLESILPLFAVIRRTDDILSALKE